MARHGNQTIRRYPLAAIAAMAMLGTGGMPAGAAMAADAAATFPEKPIRVIVPFSAGGVVDSVARITAEYMANDLHQPVIVENRAGAGGAIGTDYVAKAPADGYTLLAVSPSHVVGPMLNAAVKWNAERDFRAIAGIGDIPNLIVVPAASPLRDLPSLLAAARTAPGSLTYASPGPGTSNHLSAELLAQSAGVKLTNVPYKGQPEALTDLLGNRISMMALTVAIARPQVQSGKLVALATTAARRSAAFPSLPTVAESAHLPGFEVSAWFGLVAPRKTPDAAVHRLQKSVTKALADPAVVKRLAELGMDVAPLSAQQFDARIAAETRKWSGVLRNAGMGGS
ncbi:tripartite tricarboxylate transporter substrate binding protein [Cupriavidus necator]